MKLSISSIQFNNTLCHQIKSLKECYQLYMLYCWIDLIHVFKTNFFLEV